MTDRSLAASAEQGKWIQAGGINSGGGKTGRQEDRKTGRQEDRKTGRQEDRKTGRQGKPGSDRQGASLPALISGTQLRW